MGCKKNECALCNIYPKSEASLACDLDCYLDEKENISIRKYWKKIKPVEMACYEEPKEIRSPRRT